jgi:apolipoprotein N-acyltransferase
VPLGKGKTLYSQFGDWLGWLSLIGMFFFIIFMSGSQKKREKDDALFNSSYVQ